MMPFGLIHLPVLNNIALTHHRLCLPPCLALTQAGGSQSAHDNQGRKAKSAGAMLRRYGEEALREVRTCVGLCVGVSEPSYVPFQPGRACAAWSTPL